jgi:hypothetical protein
MSTHIQNLIRRARDASNEHTKRDITYPSRVEAKQIRTLIAELADALQGFVIGPANCRICGQPVEPGDQAHHLRSEHRGPHTFFHDARGYTTDRPSMMVAELKAMVLCTPTYQLHEERDGKAYYYSDGEAVDLTRRPHFYSVPPATF